MERTSTSKLELLIGTFIVAGVIILTGMIIASNENFSLWRDTYVVVVRINHVGDLRASAPVKLGGVEIGRVTEINLRAKYIELVTTIDAKVELTADCRASIENSGLVGDTFLELIQGQSADLLPRDIRSREEFVQRRGEDGLVDGIGTVSMNEIFNQLKAIGGEVIALTRNVNEIAGDPQVKTNIKETLTNLNATSMQANRLLASLRRSSDNVYEASKSIAATMESVQRMSATVESAVNQTVGDKRNLEAINESIANARRISRSADSLLARVDKLLADEEGNVRQTVGNVRAVSDRAREVVQAVDPQKVGEAINRLTDTIRDAGALIATIRREIAIALVINKGADRIVQAKFDDMRRDNGIGKDVDKQMEEFSRWVKEQLQKGRFDDPAYPDAKDRPYHNVGKTEKNEW